MSERPFVSKIRQLLEETRDLKRQGPRGRARSQEARSPAGPGDADADLALLNEIESGLEDGLEEGLEGPGSVTGDGRAASEAEEPAAVAGARGAGARRAGRRLRAGRDGQAAGDRPGIQRLLRFLGDLQARRAATMARGDRPARMVSPSLMKEAAGQQVEPGDPVAQRRRKQIQEFRAAWAESLNLRATPRGGSPSPAEGQQPAAEEKAPAATAAAETSKGTGGEPTS